MRVRHDSNFKDHIVVKEAFGIKVKNTNLKVKVNYAIIKKE